MDDRNLKKEYSGNHLNERDMHPNPFCQFKKWFQEAARDNVEEPNAMTLATADSSGMPSARIVLLKQFDEHGFVFYTNKESQKGEELRDNPYAALVLYWYKQLRQVRISGVVEEVSQEESERYFSSRPKGSQLGAWASKQSKVIKSRQQLDDAFADYENTFQDKSIPMPAYWGGYRVKPVTFEFWQSQANRLHDRIVYKLNAETSEWEISRLAP